jgi:hypothetical protein
MFRSLRAFRRRATLLLLPFLCQVRVYSDPEAAGWTGWIDGPLGFTVAFIDRSGGLFFRW